MFRSLLNIVTSLVCIYASFCLIAKLAEYKTDESWLEEYAAKQGIPAYEPPVLYPPSSQKEGASKTLPTKESNMATPSKPPKKRNLGSVLGGRNPRPAPQPGMMKPLPVFHSLEEASGFLNGEQEAASVQSVQATPPSGLTSPTLPTDVPDLPEGRSLGPIGINVWSKLTRILKERGTFSPDYGEALYTLCALEETACSLRDEFFGNLSHEVRGARKLNSAVNEWGKIVALLKVYYTEFGLTPKAAEGIKNSTVMNPKETPVENAKTALGGTGPSDTQEGLFDPV